MGGIEESPTVAAVQNGHFAEPPRHDRILTPSQDGFDEEAQTRSRAAREVGRQLRPECLRELGNEKITYTKQ